MGSRLRVLPLTKRLSVWGPGDVSKMVSLVALFSDWSAVSFMVLLSHRGFGFAGI